MKQTFIYKTKMSFSYFYPFIAFALIALGCWYFGYGIALKNLTLLAYPNSVYVSAAIAVLFLISAILKWKKSSQSLKNPHPITIGDDTLSFPKKNTISEIWFPNITAVKTKDDSEDGNSVVITAGNKDYEFFEDAFENKNKYSEFLKLVEEKIKKE